MWPVCGGRGFLAAMNDSAHPSPAVSDVTVWSLEQTSPADLTPAAAPRTA